MDTPDYLAMIQEYSGLTDVARVQTFEGYRSESDQVVKVEIYDYGPVAEAHRYVAHATGDNEAFTASKPAATVADALAGVDWKELDQV